MPRKLLQQVYEALKHTASAFGVQLNTIVEPSIADLELHWLALNMTLTLQILVNLVMNALEATHGRRPL